MLSSFIHMHQPGNPFSALNVFCPQLLDEARDPTIDMSEKVDVQKMAEDLASTSASSMPTSNVAVSAPAFSMSAFSMPTSSTATFSAPASSTPAFSAPHCRSFRHSYLASSRKHS